MSAPENEGWIDWAGGECPVDENSPFRVRFRDRTEKAYTRKAHAPMPCCWRHESHLGNSDIIAYRVVSK